MSYCDPTKLSASDQRSVYLLERTRPSTDLLPSDTEPSDASVHRAQQVTGELLWLSQRSRPDLSFCLLRVIDNDDKGS